MNAPAPTRPRYQTRIVSLSYTPDAMQFDSDEKMNAFFKALGYAVFYQLRNDHPDGTTQLVGLSIDKDKEINVCYHPFIQPEPADATGYRKYTGSVPYLTDKYTLALRDQSRLLGVPFVMGGIPRDGGITYSFHS